MKEKVEFERFQATDKDGRIFIIIGYQCIITHSPVYGRSVVLNGDIEYWTDFGLSVKKIDQRTFRVSTLTETSMRSVEKPSSSAFDRNAIEVYASTVL